MSLSNQKNIFLILILLVGLISRAFAQPSSNSPICEGVTLQLRANVNGSSFSWTGPVGSGFASTQKDPNIPFASANLTGEYTLVVNGSQTFKINVTVNPKPNAPQVNNLIAACSGKRVVVKPNNLSAGQTYNWRNNSSSFNVTADSIVFNAITESSQGFYTISTTRNNCISDLVSFEIQVSTTPNRPNIIPPASQYCEGDNFNLQSSTSSTNQFNWFGPRNNTATGAVFSIFDAQLNDNGIYKLVLNNNGCTSDTASVNVKITEAPAAVAVTGKTNLCEGDNLVLTAAGSAGTIYEWKDSQGNIVTTKVLNRSSISAAEAGTYSLRTKNGACFTKKTETVVIVNSLPASPAIGFNFTTLCEFQNLSLTTDPNSNITYDWKGPVARSSTSELIIPLVTIQDSGKYTLTAKVGECTSLPAEITINVIKAPSLPNHTIDTLVCTQETIKFSADANPDLSFEWRGPGIPDFGNGNVTSNRTDSIPFSVPAFSGIYTFKVNNGICDSKIDSFNVLIKKIVVSDSINLTFISNGAFVDSLCQNEDLYFDPGDYSNYEVNDIAKYRWTTPSGRIITTKDELIKRIQTVESGVWKITISNSCGAGNTQTLFKINPVPIMKIEGDTGICEFEVNKIITTGSHLIYEWSTGDTTANIEVEEPGIYSVKVTNEFACSTKDLIDVELLCRPDIYAPDAFTPNGDNFNDTYLTYCHNIDDFEITIYTRHGQVIFNTTDRFKAWDGKFNNTDLPADVYSYSIKYKTIYRKAIYEDRVNGKIFLIR